LFNDTSNTAKIIWFLVILHLAILLLLHARPNRGQEEIMKLAQIKQAYKKHTF